MSPESKKRGKGCLSELLSAALAYPTTTTLHWISGWLLYDEILHDTVAVNNNVLPPGKTGYDTQVFINLLADAYDRYANPDEMRPIPTDYHISVGDIGMLRASLHFISRNLSFQKDNNTNPLSQFSASVEKLEQKVTNQIEKNLALKLLKPLANSLGYALVYLDPALPSPTRVVFDGLLNDSMVDHPIFMSAIVLASVLGTLTTLNDIIRVSGKFLNVLTNLSLSLSSGSAESYSQKHSSKNRQPGQTNASIQNVAVMTDEEFKKNPGKFSGNMPQTFHAEGLGVYVVDDATLFIHGEAAQYTSEELAAELRKSGARVEIIHADSTVGTNKKPITPKTGVITIVTKRVDDTIVDNVKNDNIIASIQSEIRNELTYKDLGTDKVSSNKKKPGFGNWLRANKNNFLE